MRHLEWRSFWIFLIDKWTNSCHTLNSGNLLPKLAVIGQRCYEEEDDKRKRVYWCMMHEITCYRVLLIAATWWSWQKNVSKKKLRTPNENPLLPRSTPDPHQQIVAYSLLSERVTLYAFERWLVSSNRGLGQFRQAKKNISERNPDPNLLKEKDTWY